MPPSRRARRRQHGPANETGPTPAAPPRQRISPGRLWLFRLTSVFLAPVLSLAVLELGLRLGHYGSPTAFYVDADNGRVKVTNDRFGWRFFGPSMARIPEPHFLFAKPSGAIRIFVLGESAALGVPSPSFSFGRILEVMLRARYPGVRFEVANAAMTAINSYGVLEIAGDCSALEPDLFVVYMGNNEVVGPYGPGAVFQSWSPSRPLIRATLLAKSARAGQLLANVIPSFHRDRSRKAWRGMTMALDNPVAADDPRLRPTYQNFRCNLRDICRLGRRAGAAVVLSTVAVNIRDCPPFASRHRTGLGTSELARWESIYQSGIDLEDRQQWREALVRYELAAGLDDRWAELQFRMGACLAALGRGEQARARFLAACDLDVLRFRADREINAAIREVGAEQKADGVYLADTEQTLASQAGGLPGQPLFFEHVHLTFDGNYLVARTLLDQVERALPRLATARKAASVLSRQECAQALTLTPWDEHLSLERMTEAMSPPPFSSQLGHAARMAAIRERTRSLAKLSSQPESRRLYEAALESTPNDWSLHYRYGQLLMAAGEPRLAADHMRVALKAFPWNLPLHVDLGKAESLSGRNQEAIVLFQKALEMYPPHVVARAGLVSALARAGRIDDARAHLRKVEEIDPTFDGAHLALGSVLDERGDVEGAMVEFRAAVDVNPADPVAHQSLGATLADQGRVDEAIASFRKALDIDPTFEAAHMNLGLALTSQGKIQDAMPHFRAVLETKPRDPFARYNLGACLARQGRIDEAITQLRLAVEANPGYYDAHLDLGIALTGRNAQEAIVHLQKAWELDPKSSAADYNLGVALIRQGRIDEAGAHFRKALDVNPNDAAAHLALAAALRQQGRIEEAAAQVQAALLIDPANARAYCLAGQLLARRGRIDEAATAFRQALLIRPDSPEARAGLQAVSRSSRHRPARAAR